MRKIPTFFLKLLLFPVFPVHCVVLTDTGGTAAAAVVVEVGIAVDTAHAGAGADAALPARKERQEPTGTSGPQADDHRHGIAGFALRPATDDGTPTDGRHAVGDAQSGDALRGGTDRRPAAAERYTRAADGRESGSRALHADAGLLHGKLRN